MLTPEELCTRWKNSVTPRTLSNWRSTGKGPKATKVGKEIWYSLDEIEKYENKIGWVNA